MKIIKVFVKNVICYVRIAMVQVIIIAHHANKVNTLIMDNAIKFVHSDLITITKL